MANDPAILVTNFASGNWRQYHIVTDERCVTVEMVPALWGGWHFRSIHVHAGDDWRGYTRDAIVEWKIHKQAYGAAEFATDLLPEFRAKLVSIAATGKLPEAAS